MKKKENELNEREKEIKDVAYKFNNWRREERKRTETAYTRADKAREEQERLLEKKELEIKAGVKQGIKKNWQTIVQSFVKALSAFTQWELEWSELLLFLYAIAVTVAISAGYYKTELQKDIKNAGKGIAAACEWFYTAPISHAAHWVSHFIPNTIILNIVYWLIVVILFLLLIGVLLFFGAYIYRWHKTYCSLIVTCWITVVYFIAVYFFIEYIPCNVFIVYVIIMILNFAIGCIITLKATPYEHNPKDLFEFLWSDIF